MRQVLVVGPTSRDLVLTVPALPSPDAPVEASGRREVIGGKGALQALALARGGGAPRLLSAVGDDVVGPRLADRLAAEGVDVAALRRRAGCRTGLITEILDPDGPRFVLDIPPRTRLAVEDVRAAAPAFAGVAAVIVSLEESAAVAAAAIERARAVGAPVVTDGAVDAGERGALTGASVLRADTTEAGRLVGHALPDRAATEAAARELLGTGLRVVVLEVGEGGNLVVWRDEDGGTRACLVPLPDLGAEEPIDSTGAGDAFVATLTLALDEGDAPDDAVRRATAASARVVVHVGGRAPDVGDDL